MLPATRAPERDSSGQEPRERTGMASDSYNEAVRLQSKVRDWIGFPVSMADALRIAREVVEHADAHLLNVEIDGRTIKAALEEEAEERERERLAEQRRISQNAGGSNVTDTTREVRTAEP